VRYVDLDKVLPDGLVRDQAHVEPVAEHFRRAGVDCLFLPHCNFGTEGAVGMIGRRLGLPVLLWGPRDDAPEPDGTRLRDTLCGLFASSKVLVKLGVPFSYIENCSPDEPRFREGLDAFLRGVAMADVLRGRRRIGQIGQRIDFFWTTIVNESELLERFGVEVLPIDMAEFIEHLHDRARRGEAGYRDEAARLRETLRIEDLDDGALVRILAMRDQALALAEDLGLDALAVKTFPSLLNALGAYGSLASSLISETLPYAAETDIHGALSALMLRRATGTNAPTFLTEFTVRHPDNDNAVLLWHCGAPLSQAHPEVTPRLGKHWILPGQMSGMTHFRLQDGPLTVLRFDGETGNYQLAVGQGHSVPGPETLNNYLWMQVDDWPRWERALIEGPFIHHCAMAPGHLADAARQAVRFVPGLELVELSGPRRI
jgi:L-fucose isomerase-like protein